MAEGGVCLVQNICAFFAFFARPSYILNKLYVLCLAFLFSCKNYALHKTLLAYFLEEGKNILDVNLAIENLQHQKFSQKKTVEFSYFHEGKNNLDVNLAIENLQQKSFLKRYC